MRDLPVRGDLGGIGLPLPPARMPAMHRGRPLKRWHYVGVYRADVMLCIVSARVAGIPQRWWAAALPDGSLFQGRRGVHVDARHARVRGVAELELSPPPERVQVVSPHGRSYVWTMKSAPVHVTGEVRVGGRVFRLDGDDGFVDESAGYHARHTAWRWSAGIGRTDDGRAVAWNLVDGVHDGVASERTVWLDGSPEEVPSQEFSADLSRVGELAFTEWASREARVNLGIVRNRYRQPFGEFSGRLPGGLRVAEGYGVMEEHDVLW